MYSVISRISTKNLQCLKSPWLNHFTPKLSPHPTTPQKLLTTGVTNNTNLLSRIFFRKPKPRFRLGVVAGGSSVLLFMWSIRRYRDSLVMDLSTSVHSDQSAVSISTARSQVVPTVKIVTTTDSRATIVDHEKYSEFVQTSIDALLQAQQEMEKEASKLLADRLNCCFSNIHPRAEQFADWYFSYSTSFKLLQEATLSLARHAAKFMEKTPINEAVSSDMDRFMTQKYERIVLRPEINNSELQAAYLQCVKDIHAHYAGAVHCLEENMSNLLAEHTDHMKQPQAGDIRLSLDWGSQLHKIKTVPANFEKNPELTLALSSGGALVGKTLASKGASLATTKALAGKLTAPFVSKAVAAGGGAMAGSVAGPVGTLLGATIGIGIDYTVNAGIELVKREEFVKDVNSVVDATQKDYFHVLEAELHRATRVWVGDAIQLLPQLGQVHACQKEGRDHPSLGGWLQSFNAHMNQYIWNGTRWIYKLSPF
eukprot:GFUD01135290.1.p1 GENE.GFUD01135290.1~~GFUD01135290.1.p1  ORF type:complete len:482 (-),score=79.48 GFUD01135290.1:135-1580(-)